MTARGGGSAQNTIFMFSYYLVIVCVLLQVKKLDFKMEAKNLC